MVATNAYSDRLIPGLRESLITVHSFQIATAPLSPNFDAAILPGRQGVSDSRRILCYFRRTADGRLIFGGRGSMAEPSRPEAWQHLVRALHRAYPAVTDVPITHRWFGRVAITPDHLPHVHEPAPGLLTAVGCQGRGIGLQTALGEAIAASVVAGDRDLLPFPVMPIRPIPLHRFRHIGLGALIAFYRTLDGFETLRAA
jgi:glycine/D-amino acid oxidase-like deaminating enzyme